VWNEALAAANDHALLIINSYRHWTGTSLIDTPVERDHAFRTLFFAPIVVLSHGTEADPILNFGNRAALKLWGMSWSAFTRMPSRLTAEPLEREQRAAFMKSVAERGYTDQYTGIRISASGRRFRIENATVWNLMDHNGEYRGQAAAFRTFQWERDE
jgi:hypothetical protein